MIELAIIGSDMQEVIGCAIAFNLLSVGRFVFVCGLKMDQNLSASSSFSSLFVIIQDPTVGRSSHHHHRHVCVPLFRQIRCVTIYNQTKNTFLISPSVFTCFYLSRLEET